MARGLIHTWYPLTGINKIKTPVQRLTKHTDLQRLTEDTDTWSYSLPGVVVDIYDMRSLVIHERYTNTGTRTYDTYYLRFLFVYFVIPPWTEIQGAIQNEREYQTVLTFPSTAEW